MRLLGRKSELTGLLRAIRELPAKERGPAGKAANEVKTAVDALLTERGSALEAAELDERLRTDSVDVTLAR